MYGESSIREVELVSGKVLREKQMASQDFGEGLVKVGDRYPQCHLAQTPMPLSGPTCEEMPCFHNLPCHLPNLVNRKGIQHMVHTVMAWIAGIIAVPLSA